MNKSLLILLFLLFTAPSFAGLLEQCGKFKINGIIKPLNEDYVFEIFPDQLSSIQLKIKQELDLDKKLLPKNLKLFEGIAVQVTGKIKKRITARKGELWLEQIDYRKVGLTESRDLKQNLTLIKKAKCLK